jgi:hypothetical protein
VAGVIGGYEQGCCIPARVLVGAFTSNVSTLYATAVAGGSHRVLRAALSGQLPYASL